MIGQKDEAESRVAWKTEELITMVREVLTSAYTQSVISSLIAKSNEASQTPAA